MPIVAGRTRKQLRLSIGNALGAVTPVTATAGGSTTTFLTDDLVGGTDDHKGKILQFTGPTNNAGSTRLVTASSIAASRTTLTFYPSGTSVAASDTAELWDEKYPPARIHDLMNQAIIEVQGRVYKEDESVALFADGRETRFDVPSAFSMLNLVQYRAKVEGKIIHLATTAWTAGSNTTASTDSKDYKRGPGSCKLVVTAAATAGTVIATKAITSVSLAGYDTVEFWIKSTVATASGDLQLLLDDTALAVSPLETLNVPALTANIWTFVRVAMATPALDTAIISVGLKYTVDIGAVTIWINDVEAVLNDTASWVRLSKDSWRIDQLNRDLVLTNGGRRVAGYHLLKLVGGDRPALLNADATATEIDEQFVISRSVELALLASSGGPQTDPDALRALAAYWGQKAAVALRGMPYLASVREIG